MDSNLALREQESAEIRAGRSRRLYLVLRANQERSGPDVGRPAPNNAKEFAMEGEPVPVAEETLGYSADQHALRGDWLSRVPDELLVASAAVGGCIGFPIGAAVEGVVVGFIGGLLGALAGAMALLGMAWLWNETLRLIRGGGAAANTSDPAYTGIGEWGKELIRRPGRSLFLDRRRDRLANLGNLRAQQHVAE